MNRLRVIDAVWHIVSFRAFSANVVYLEDSCATGADPSIPETFECICMNNYRSRDIHFAILISDIINSLKQARSYQRSALLNDPLS